jgi:hypothetical protein
MDHNRDSASSKKAEMGTRIALQRSMHEMVKLITEKTKTELKTQSKTQTEPPKATTNLLMTQ